MSGRDGQLEWLNAGGGRYRLPSEAEWEFAARGEILGMGFQYSGRDDWAVVAWYYANSGSRMHPVGLKQANALGIFDMSGNAREWVQDCYYESYVGAPNDGGAWEEGVCQHRVVRNGSWYGKPSYVGVSNRFWCAAYFRNNNLGFRVVRLLAEQ